MPHGFHLLISAQFTSALADNALLIVAIALLQEQGLPGWWAPLLKFSFTIAYVVLAPFVGPLADAVPKARLMAWMNGLKALGVLALMAGLHPVAAFAVVGLGAAAYAPAKYGLVTELVGPRRLVAANGWIEVSVVCAALLGTVFGGLLVSDLITESFAASWVRELMAALSVPWPTALGLSMLLLLAVYGVAAMLQLGVPDSGARYPGCSVHVADLVRHFRVSNCTLWKDRDGGLSLAVTTLFWGAGATLQFAVLRWATEILGLSLERAAYLQAAVAVGVVAGAAFAGRNVPLRAAPIVMPAGVVLGLLVACVAFVDGLLLAVPLLLIAGAFGGILVVPMNALLQHRGFRLLTAGRSIAVQGFNENLSVLAMLAGYAALLAVDVPITALMCGFGVTVAASMLLMIARRRETMRSPARAALKETPGRPKFP